MLLPQLPLVFAKTVASVTATGFAAAVAAATANGCFHYCC